MTAVLEAPPSSVSFGSGYVFKEERTLQIRCHDRYFRDAIVNDEDGNKLFDMSAKQLFTSWSLRRTLIDASGEHYWDLRYHRAKLTEWIAEDATGKELGKIKNHTKVSSKALAAEAIVHTDSGDKTIDIKSFDVSGLKTVFEVDGATIAELTMTDNNDSSFLHMRDMDRSVWSLRVAAGVDVALVLAMSFFRCEVSHAYRR